MASLTSTGFSVISGGLAGIVVVRWWPDLWRYEGIEAAVVLRRIEAQ